MATRYDSYNESLSSSRTAIVKTKTHNNNKDQPNFTSMVKNFMDKKTNSSSKPTAFSGLQKKLFGEVGKKKREKSVKGEWALTEVNGNMRSLGMVLRSERELLGANKELEVEVEKLKALVEDKSREVEKLKDLCLKQKEEIKALKSTMLFPEDEVNCQLQYVLERQGKELKQTKQLIPTLQKQVTSLTDQLQCLADDLAEVKAEKFVRARVPCAIGSLRTPTYDPEQAANSLEFSSCEPASPGSPDDMFLKDLNPCLTPYDTKTKSKEFEEMSYDSTLEECLSQNSIKGDFGFNSQFKMSKSSDNYQSSNLVMTVKAARRSEDSKRKYGKQMHR